MSVQVFHSTRIRKASAKAMFGVIVLAFGCQAAPYQLAQPTETEAEELVIFRRLSPFTQLSALRRLARPKQLRWIQLIREYDPAMPWTAQAWNYEPQVKCLLALNDVETARWLARQYEQNGAYYALLELLSEWHTPEGLAFVAKQALSDEPYGERGTTHPISFDASHILLSKMVPEIVDIPVAVRDWARKLEGEYLAAGKRIQIQGGDTKEASKQATDYVEHRRRQIAQVWWRANEKALLAGRWQEVQPGEGYDTPKLHAILAQFTGQQPKPPAAVATPTPTATTRPDLPPHLASESQASIHTHYIGLALVLIGAAIAVVWRMIRKRRD